MEKERKQSMAKDKEKMAEAREVEKKKRTRTKFQKNIYLVPVLLWHQYVRGGMFFVSRKGTFVKD